MQRRRTRIGRRAAAIGTAALLLTSGAAYGVDLLIDTEGHTTLEQLLVPTGAGAFKDLTLQPGGEPYVVRDGDQNEAGTPIPDAIQAQPGRDQRRISLAYVSQMTDFQLADEESPARVEFLDVNFNDPEGCPPQFCGPFPNSGPASAHRPQEALTGFQIDATIRQLNALVPASPVTDGEGNRRSMDFSLATGDQADNNQRNETEWVRDILEGNGPISFNSGSANPLDYDDPEELLLPGCAAYAAPLMGEGLPGVVSLSDAPKYTGVQDYDDYDESQTPLYYDPDDPRDLYAAWPTYTGLMDRAQQIEIDPEGLDVPSYVTNGNHDVLTQGNEDANNEFERIATGCLKVLASTAEGVPPDPNVLLAPASAAITVPRDPLRRAVAKPQIKAIYGANDQDDDHGFEFVDPAEEVASRPVADAGTGPGAARYYAWYRPETPGFRFISIDTNW